MINFQISDALIKQVKKVVKVHGECHVLGCGNFYTTKETAIRKKDYTNPDQEEATFMLSFYKVEEVPNTVTEMEDAFYNSRRQESKIISANEIASNRNIIDMSDDEDDEPTVKPKAKAKRIVEPTPEEILEVELIEPTVKPKAKAKTQADEDLEYLKNN